MSTKKKYPRIERTSRVSEIIEMASKHKISMTAPVAKEYEKLSNISVIEKRITRDAAIARAFNRKSIPKKLASESVKGKLDKKK